MSTERYTTILGEVIEYSKPSAEVAAFLERVKRAAHDPSMSESQLSELVYGRENPVLDQTVFPGRGAVTKAVHANPVWHVMQDLLDAKRVQSGRLDVGAANAAFSLTVAEAAERLEMSEGAVRQAIASEKLAAVKRGSVYLIDPASVETYRERVKRRGPEQREPEPRSDLPPPKGRVILMDRGKKREAALYARVGNEPGGSFRLKAADTREIARADGHVVDVAVLDFVQAAVVFGGRAQQRMFVLELADEEDSFAFKSFFVKGRYRVVRKVNNPADAAMAWRAFEPIASLAELDARIEEALSCAEGARENLVTIDRGETEAYYRREVDRLREIRERVAPIAARRARVR